ncbi:phenoloxidase-activating factor 2-like [Drosophila eugracilis]|uniref:phenoloxidase-activating factor 2-like n=1 Tax=Drosophila eugracilis TaxID=29029 RepID=UPI001BDA99AC|nr:phenoloxidase-activating factor 2-like [Drosophila eugracilis]
METSIPSEHNQCGVSNVAGVFMTLKGGRLETSFAEYPWTAAIFDTRNKFLCNGVLISYKVVLTTATCLAPYQPLIVRAGDWDLATDRETVPHKTREVQDLILHEQFNWDSMQDNIALLILKEEFPRLQHIVPVCLIQEGVDLDYKKLFCHRVELQDL